ncbi:MAG: hypothetical protein ACI8RZ_007990 [Myxococcota bacterium]|jgi:hypothetical protein
MNPIQASLQLTIASGGRVIVKGDPAGVPIHDTLQILSSARVVLRQIEAEPIDVVICTWPVDQALARELCERHRVAVMMMIPVNTSRDAAIAFARQLRNCSLLPETFSLSALMGLSLPTIGETLSPDFLRRLPRLTRLWGLKKTGVVQFLLSDGAWDWISIKDGGLVEAGDIPLIRSAMQQGRMRFLERAIHGDASREAMGRMLLELAGVQTDTRFAAIHRSWTPQPCHLGDLPVSEHARSLMGESDGTRTLRHLLGARKVFAGSVSEELHALVRLRLVQLKPPDQSWSRPPRHRLRARIQREQARLEPRDGAALKLGLPPQTPPALRRKIARWQHERYDRISESPQLSSALQQAAMAVSEHWMGVFVTTPPGPQQTP